MRILVAAHRHPSLSLGGAELAAYRLFRELRHVDGISACFLSCDDSSNRGDLPEPGLEPPSSGDEYSLSTGAFDRFFLSDPDRAGFAAFRALVAELRPDVFHFHHYLNYGTEILAEAKRLRPSARLVLTLHDYMAICHHHGLMVKTDESTLCDAAEDRACADCFDGTNAATFARRRQRIRRSLEPVDIFIAPSAFLRRRYIDWGLDAERIVVLENGVVPVPPPPPDAPKTSRAVFGFFGQIHPFKGLHCLLSAFDHLPPAGPDSEAAPRLVVNGAYLELNHPAYAALVNKALSRHAARVRFAGPYQPDELGRRMAEVDWVVVPSLWWENSPIVIQEALAHRRPVLCSDIGGMREKIRHGLDGFHFPAGNHAALATLIGQLAADRQIWRRLQSTMRLPVTMCQSAAQHLTHYRRHA